MKILLAVPVYNEERVLRKSIAKLNSWMSKNVKDSWKIVIANNGSTDGTKKIANELAARFSNVKAVHIGFKGRGNSLKKVWGSYDADVYAYCDSDLATDLSCLKELFGSVANGNNVVTGSRYLKDSNSKRTFSRLVMSKGYNYLVRLFFRTSISDFQCGFKALDKKAVEAIVPKTRNKKWFFDTELLLLAEHSGKYNIKEIPVRWKEKKGTKVRFLRTIGSYIANLARLRMSINNRLS